MIISLILEKDRIQYEAPPDTMTDDLKKMIANEKDTITKILQGSFVDECIQQAVDELDNAGVDIRKVSNYVRRKTLDLEFEMTAASSDGDLILFKTLLDQWKNLFLGRTQEKQLDLHQGEH